MSENELARGRDPRRWALRLEERQVRAFLDRDFSSSVLNDTKWSEALNALEGLAVKFYVRFVDSDQERSLNWLRSATPAYFDSDLGPFLKLSVEWLDIDPVSHVHHGLLDATRIDPTGEIERRLRSTHVPFMVMGDRIRIVGHVRRGSNL